MSLTQRSYLIILCLALLSTLYNAFLPLHGDEAYYWMWSRSLQGGYFDHPPMIAYLIYLSDFISASEWSIRLVNVIAMSITAVIIHKLTCKLSDEESAYKAVLIFASVVIIHAGFTVTTPDSPLILFWALTLYSSYAALFENSSKHFYFTGLYLGLLMLSKYTAILFVFALLLFILLFRRDIFKDIRFYAAILLALIVVSPLLYWNYQHDWISFLFQLSHGKDSTQISLNSFFEFFGAQFGIYSPIFLGIFFYYLYKERLFIQNKALLFLALNALVVMLFFQYKALSAFLEINYDAPAFIAITIIVAIKIKQKGLHKLFTYGIALALLITLIARVGLLTHLEVLQDRMYGNKEAIALLEKHRHKNDAIYGSHLTFAALLQYYLSDHPHTQVLTPSRFSHYEMIKEKGWLHDGLFLSISDKRKALDKLYNDVTLLEQYRVTIKGAKEKIFYIYRVSNAYTTEDNQ